MKLFNAKLLKYELKSQIKNWYIPFFGLVFPIFMSQIITRNALGDVPEGILPYAHIKVFFSFAMYIPMCCVFLAHSNNYGYEVEREIPLRLKLFGIPEFTQISCRLQSVLIVSTVAIAIFCLSFFLSFETPKPSISAVAISIAVFYLLCISLFLLAHSLAIIIRRYEATSGIAMVIYFICLFMGGGLGLQQNTFPKFLKTVFSIFPFYYLNETLGGLFYKATDTAPLFQSLIFFMLLGLAMLFIGLRQVKTRR